MSAGCGCKESGPAKKRPGFFGVVLVIGEGNFHGHRIGSSEWPFTGGGTMGAVASRVKSFQPPSRRVYASRRLFSLISRSFFPADEEISRHLTRAEIEEALKPESYLGEAIEAVDRIVGGE